MEENFSPPFYSFTRANTLRVLFYTSVEEECKKSGTLFISGRK